jgi:hypothetical protein
MLDSAAYFQERGQPEKAVTLFQKAGNMNRAMELCFSAQLFEPLATLVEALGSDSNADPTLLAKCAKYFLDHNQYSKAVDLFIKGKQHDHGLQLALDHDVIITEDMAEAMTPGKGEMEDEMRRELLNKVAKVCKQSGQLPSGMQEVYAGGRQGEGDEGAAQIGRYGEDHLLRRREPQPRHLRHVRQLPADPRLAQRRRGYEVHHQLLHKGARG